MLENPQITQSTAQVTAVIRMTVPREEMAKVMGPGIGEVMAAVQAQGIATTGAWFSHHLRMDPKVFDFEVGVPVASAVKPAGRVVPSSLPATKVARTVYQGPYEKLGAAWGEFSGWIEQQQLKTAEDLWECYLSGPESGSDPSQFRTELNRPLLR